MTQALLHAQRKIFGPSIEASKQIPGQGSLFDAIEPLVSELLKEQQKISVPSHTRNSRKPGVRAEMLEGLEKEVVEYLIDPDDTCEVCGSNLKIVGQKLIRTETEFIPTPLLPHSIATASLVAQVMQQKVMLGVPFVRQEKYWYQLGLMLTRSNMANWSIRCTEEWLMPIYNRIHNVLMNCHSCLHMDETRIQCNKEATITERYNQRQETSKVVLEAFWMWIDETALLETTNEKLTKALNYATNHKSEFNTFLEDGTLELSNNLCEASIRPFATHRRSWLFADTPAGATTNAVLYTLVETAKLNKLNVFEYLKYLLEEMPNNDFENKPEIINSYLPWSDELPEKCRMIKK